MNTYARETEGLLIYKGDMIATKITVRYAVDNQRHSILSMCDEAGEIYVSIKGGPFLLWLKTVLNSEFGRNAQKLYSGALYGENCYDVNNLLKQDKRKEQEDEKQEDAGERTAGAQLSGASEL